MSWKSASNSFLFLSSFSHSFIYSFWKKGVKSSKSFPGYYIQLMPPHGVLLCYKRLSLVVQWANTMCVCAACHRGWPWLCWGGTEGDLATAHRGPGHSKSVSFGGDPSREFKRVHYRLVNASAEGETLLTALNSPGTISLS